MLIFPALAFVCVVLTACSVSGLAVARADAGEKLFRQCADCHAIKKGAQSYGPNLYCVVGRPAGSVAAYDYSSAMQKAGQKGLTWTEANIIAYLENPRKFLEEFDGSPDIRNKMTFMLPDMQQRENVVAYVKSLTAGCNGES